jgi:hypothetical protein
MLFDMRIRLILSAMIHITLRIRSVVLNNEIKQAVAKSSKHKKDSKPVVPPHQLSRLKINIYGYTDTHTTTHISCVSRVWCVHCSVLILDVQASAARPMSVRLPWTVLTVTARVGIASDNASRMAPSENVSVSISKNL